MSDKPRNEWAEMDFWVSAYDHVKGEWREVNVLEMSEDDWRKWVCWQLMKARERDDAARGVQPEP